MKIDLFDYQTGEVFSAEVLVLAERNGATIGVALFDQFAVPVVIHADGEIMCADDWHGTYADDDIVGVYDIRWMRARDGADCIVMDGLPRVLE